MAVQKIEQYRQKNGDDILKVILKPTKKFSNGYFYCDSENEDLVKNYEWMWHAGVADKLPYVDVTYKKYPEDSSTTLRFHKLLAERYLGTSDFYLDHINCVEFDNIQVNLNAVDSALNQRNRFVRGYRIQVGTHRDNFQPKLVKNRRFISSTCSKKEDEACRNQYLLEQEYCSDYNYNFLLDRRNDLNILDDERTGKISEEEATYRHVLRYADNAWYYLRYNLEQYFKENHIPVPNYDLDEQGFMIDKITRKRLCPFN